MFSQCFTNNPERKRNVMVYCVLEMVLDLHSFYLLFLSGQQFLLFFNKTRLESFSNELPFHFFTHIHNISDPPCGQTSFCSAVSCRMKPLSRLASDKITTVNTALIRSGQVRHPLSRLTSMSSASFAALQTRALGGP